MPSLSAEGAHLEALAKLLEVRGVELYHALMPVSARLAAGVLSALLSAGERLREDGMHDNEGDDAVDINLVVDAGLRRGLAVIYLQAHRGSPALQDDSPHLAKGVLKQLLDALAHAERAQEDEAQAILRTLPVEIEAWLGDATRQALATAQPSEVQLWGQREPLVVGAELLVLALRRLLREVVGG